MKESENEANKGEQMRHGGMRNVDRRDGEVFWGDWGGNADGSLALVEWRGSAGAACSQKSFSVALYLWAGSTSVKALSP